MASISRIPFTWGSGTHPTVQWPLCQLTHRRVLADQQVRVKEVVGEEGQSVHLAWRSEDKSVSQVPSGQLLEGDTEWGPQRVWNLHPAPRLPS